MPLTSISLEPIVGTDLAVVVRYPCNSPSPESEWEILGTIRLDADPRDFWPSLALNAGEELTAHEAWQLGIALEYAPLPCLPEPEEDWDGDDTAGDELL